MYIYKKSLCIYVCICVCVYKRRTIKNVYIVNFVVIFICSGIYIILTKI